VAYIGKERVRSGGGDIKNKKKEKNLSGE